VLVVHHGPFAWGRTAGAALENAVVMEFVAAMALDTFRLAPDATAIPQSLLDRHFFRKHGPGAYYGQQAPMHGSADITGAEQKETNP
jgi:L-ribulose-5-phosphate 4-epimerase